MTSRKISVRCLMAVLGVVLATLLFHGCSGGGEGSSATGTLKVAITDRPANDFKEVWLSIREIRVVPTGMENAADNDPGLPLVNHFDTARSIDVMQLRYKQQLLGEAVLRAGTYSQIRLILDPNPAAPAAPVNYVVLNSAPGTKVPLTTPSAQQSGLKVLGPLEVQPGVINAVVIDFDPNTAIVARGNGDYNFKPTGIRLVRMADVIQNYGTLAGNVISAFKDFSSATVTIKRRGVINDVDSIASGMIFSSYTSGRWQAPFAAFVPYTTSSIRYRAFVSANRFQLYSSPLSSVVAGQTTDLGDILLSPAP